MIIKEFFKGYVSDRYPESKLLTSPEYKMMEEAFIAGMFTFKKFMDDQSVNPDLVTAGKNLARLGIEINAFILELKVKDHENKVQNRS